MLQTPDHSCSGTLSIRSNALTYLSLLLYNHVVVVKSLSRVWLCNPMDCTTPGFPVHHQLWSLLKHVHWLGDAIYYLVLFCPLLLLPSIFPSIRVFSNESALHIRWPKYWSFSFSISLSIEYLGLISFRKDWLDLLAVQGTLKSLLQHLSSKASILRCSAFFIVQLSHPYMTLEKPKLCWQTSVGKVMSLLFNMLSRMVITFHPRSKCLLISWLQSPSAVILEPQKLVLFLFRYSKRWIQTELLFISKRVLSVCLSVCPTYISLKRLRLSALFWALSSIWSFFSVWVQGVW